MAKLSRVCTAIAISAWVALSAYLYAVVPSLAVVVEGAGTAASGVERIVFLPRVAFLALGLLAAVGLALKDRWLGRSCALLVTTVLGAPACLVLAALLHAFLVPVE